MMTFPEQDDLHRVRFDWPEPLVIELLAAHYDALVPAATPRSSLARQHQAMLRRLVEDAPADREGLRAQLVANLHAIGLDGTSARRGEEVVFFELMRVVGQRFRNSPRLREAYCKRLEAALADTTPAAPTKPQNVSAIPVRRGPSAAAA